MKKSLSILLSLFLTAIIVYGGSGVNVYFFCGSDCRHANDSAVLAGHSCGNETGEHSCTCCASMNEAEGCCATPTSADDTRTACNVERVSVNWQPVQSEKLLANPVSFDLFSDFAQHTTNQSVVIRNLTPWQQTASQKPPNLSKDDYFSLLNILII
ncbi:MAG: hypothetical protein LBS52_01715 [Dysgonamonadaceae bacterium]|jgi:hypothetical protein|nr:hypothetical protein [Dysgonamonadaceae bacterium]